MALQSLSFLILLCAMSVLLMLGVAGLWNRWRGLWAVPARALSLLLVMVMGALVAATVVNRELGFSRPARGATAGHRTSD